MSKATSLSLQVPQSTSIIHGQFLPSQLWVSLCWYHCQDRFSILIMKIGLVIFIFPCSGQCGFICQMWHIWSCFDVWQYHIKCFYSRITVCKALHECLVPYMTCMHTAAKEAKYEYLIYPLHSNEYWVPDKMQQPWGTKSMHVGDSWFNSSRYFPSFIHLLFTCRCGWYGTVTDSAVSTSACTIHQQ